MKEGKGRDGGDSIKRGLKCKVAERGK